MEALIWYLIVFTVAFFLSNDDSKTTASGVLMKDIYFAHCLICILILMPLARACFYLGELHG